MINIDKALSLNKYLNKYTQNELMLLFDENHNPYHQIIVVPINPKLLQQILDDVKTNLLDPTTVIN